MQLYYFANTTHDQFQIDRAVDVAPVMNETVGGHLAYAIQAAANSETPGNTFIENMIRTRATANLLRENPLPAYFDFTREGLTQRLARHFILPSHEALHQPVSTDASLEMKQEAPATNPVIAINANQNKKKNTRKLKQQRQLLSNLNELFEQDANWHRMLNTWQNFCMQQNIDNPSLRAYWRHMESLLNYPLHHSTPNDNLVAPNFAMVLSLLAANSEHTSFLQSHLDEVGSSYFDEDHNPYLLFLRVLATVGHSVISLPASYYINYHASNRANEAWHEEKGGTNPSQRSEDRLHQLRQVMNYISLPYLAIILCTLDKNPSSMHPIQSNLLRVYSHLTMCIFFIEFMMCQITVIKDYAARQSIKWMLDKQATEVPDEKYPHMHDLDDTATDEKKIEIVTAHPEEEKTTTAIPGEVPSRFQRYLTSVQSFQLSDLPFFGNGDEAKHETKDREFKADLEHQPPTP